jgi:hypothetical protein
MLLLFFVGVNSVWGQSSLPVVDDVDTLGLQVHCQQILDALAKVKAALPQETERELRALVKEKKKASDETAVKIQKLLNEQCLVAVSINPESRVKAARGPRSAELRAGKDTVVLIRVLNEAGVTHGLSVQSPQMRAAGESNMEKWLEITVYPEKPSEQKLSGQRVEYVLLRLKAQKTGKREATLVFDVGQGTQDLGFRAEVPILFTIRENGEKTNDEQ